MTLASVRPALLVPLLALALAGCNKSSDTAATVPSPLKCQVSGTLAQSPVAASGGPASVNVTAAPECAWTASTNAPWITNLAPTSGQGNGQVQFQVAANTSPNARSGQITLNEVNMQVVQTGASCQYAISPASQSFSAGAQIGAVVVTAQTDCTWTATSSAPWLVVVSGANGTGNGKVAFTVTANTGPTRVGTLTIGDQTFTVTQQGTCAFTLTPTGQSLGASGGAGTTVTVRTASGCAWTATTADPWITPTAPASGNGDGTFTFTVAANTGAARSGTISVGGQLFTVSQAGSCAVSISPASQSIAAAGGAATPISVTAAAGCSWTATTPDAWIALGNPASGTGIGTVSFTVAATTGPSRTGTVLIAGQTHTVTQASGCTYSLNSTSASFSSAQSAGGPVTVTAGTGCTWTATTNASWITVVTGASGSGNGTVTFNVDANTSGAARTGTLTIAGVTFTVTQA